MAKNSEKKYTFMELIIEVLEEENKPLTIEEIWDRAIRTGKANKLGTKGKTPQDTIRSIIYVDIRDNIDTRFVRVLKRPATFGLNEKKYSENEWEKPLPEKDKCSLFDERDLHPLLTSFVYRREEFACQTKTIYHEKTPRAKKGVYEWLHPDIVGIHYPDGDYSPNVISLQEKMGCSEYKLYSFEMKKRLDYSNLREYYFQAVSNSSWANEGYLVTLEIDEDVDFMNELRRLNNAFGIGIIQLNPENVSQSRVLFQSKISTDIDWDTIDKLVDNPDFNDFIQEIISNRKYNIPQNIFDEAFKTDEECRVYSIKKKIIK